MKRFFNLLWWRKRKKQKQENTIPEINVPTIIESSPVQEALVEEEGILHLQKSSAVAKEVVLSELEQTVAEAPPVREPKGDAFQEYVIERFKGSFFELAERRMDKYYEGNLANTSSLPELEFQFRTSFHNFRIAIECKWKPDFIKGRVDWAKGHQMAAYRQYQQELDITFFVLIGIGGDPADPRDVYIVPLRDIRSNVLSDLQLTRYKRIKEGSFYFDGNTMELF